VITIKTESVQALRARTQDSHMFLNWKHLTLFLLTIGVLVLCWMIAMPFLSAIVGAITLTVVTHRPYCWLESRTKRPTIAATLGVLGVTVSIITPAFFLVEELARQALTVVNLLRTGEPQQRLADLLSRHPTIAARLESAARQIDLGQASQSTASYVAGHLAGWLGNTFGAFTQLVVMVFILFFLYRDHRLAIVSLKAVLPLDDVEKELLLDRANGTIYATALGRVAVAAVQGFLAGLAFWVLGVDGAAFWGLVTVVVAIIPAVGASLVWIPVAVYLATTGHWVKAGLLVAWGGLAVSTIDNFLYPSLVGSRVQQHTVMVLISVIGAIALFGVSGLIIGPVVLTVAKTLLEIWGGRTESN
jgi:predicted PurR-regulated permease PerM